MRSSCCSLSGHLIIRPSHKSSKNCLQGTIPIWSTTRSSLSLQTTSANLGENSWTKAFSGRSSLLSTRSEPLSTAKSSSGQRRKDSISRRSRLPTFPAGSGSQAGQNHGLFFELSENFRNCTGNSNSGEVGPSWWREKPSGWMPPAPFRAARVPRFSSGNYPEP